MIGLNDEFAVELTATGRRIYREHFRELVERGLIAMPPDDPPRAMPLWELMQIFGPHVYHGMPETPFVGNTIAPRD